MSAAWVEAVEGAATIWSDPRSGEVDVENAIAISQGCDVSASTGTASPQRSGARSNPSERMLIPSYIPMTQPSESQTHRSPLKVRPSSRLRPSLLRTNPCNACTFGD